MRHYVPGRDPRPGVSQVGECCYTCQFFTYGEQRGWPHASCRGHMAIVDNPYSICEWYRVCADCRYR